MIAEALLFDQKFYIEYSENNWKNSFNLRHFHHSYEIYYLLENEVTYYINNKIYNMKPGSVIIVPPNTIHTTHSPNSSQRKRILINLPPYYIEPFLKDDPNLLKRLHTPPFSITEQKRKKVENLLYAMLEEFNKASPRKILIKSFLIQFLIELGEISQEHFKSNIPNCDDPATKRMLDILDYINSNYYRKITLTTLSEAFFLNPSYISRSFRKKFNLTFSDYLRTVRIKEVCQLLETSSLKLEEIAEATGFNDSGDLCRTFKAIMQISPSKYKLSKRNISNIP